MRLKTLLTAAGAVLAAPMAYAQAALDGLDSIGKPIPAGMGFQPAATELARDLQWLDGLLLVIITAISLL